MKTLIIGGTLFLGRFIVEELVARGHEVSVFHRGQHEPEDDSVVAKVPHLHGDRHDERRLADVVEGYDALVDVDPRNDDNVLKLLAIAADRVDRLAVISSIHVYSGIHGGRTQPVPLNEQASVLRDSEYYPYRGSGMGLDDFDAVLIERGLRESPYAGRVETVVLRMPEIYGPHDYFAREWPWIQAARAKREVLVLGAGASWLRQRVFVADAARAVVVALETPACANEVLNVGEYEVRTIAQLASEIWETCGEASPRLVLVPDEFLPEHLAHLCFQPQHWWADTTRLRTLTGFVEALSYEERLRQTVMWHIDHPPDSSWFPAFDYGAEDELIEILSAPRHDGEAKDNEEEESPGDRGDDATCT